ncbi:MAG: aryl-sulfate sulfotransferase [Tenuifilaceae bacterium]
MKSKSIVIVIVLTISLLFVISCNKDEISNLKNENSTLININKLYELKILLLKEKDSNNLIDTIEKQDNKYLIHFEEGEIVQIDTSFIKEFEIRKADWRIRFIYNDSDSLISYYKGNSYSFDEKNIVLDPYKNSPLTALIKLKTPVLGKISISVLGKSSNGITISKSFNEFSDYHELPILGLYQDYDNIIEVKLYSSSGKIRNTKLVSIKTNKIMNIPSITINKNMLNPADNGIFYISDLKIGLDQKGDVRWVYTGDAKYLFPKLINGNLIVSSNLNSIMYHSKSFYEITMLGQIIKEYIVPNYTHHDIRELPNGNFLVVTNSKVFSMTSDTNQEDMVVEMNRSSGEIVKEFNFSNILDPTRTKLPSSRPNDWLHVNCAYYDETDNSLVISGRSQSAIVKIDYNTSNIKWILANHYGWNTNLTTHLLKPVDANGQNLNVSNLDFWPYGQHAPRKIANKHILLYDNGDYRNYYDDPNTPQNSYSRAVEYKIDEQNMTVQLVWQYTSNKNIFTAFTGFIDQLSNTGNRLICYMAPSDNSPKIVEIDNNDQVIFDANINSGGVNYYRTYKFALYDNIE